MKDSRVIKLYHQDEYWDLLTSTLSSYEIKDISDSGKMIKRLIKDNYFLVKDVWNASDIGEIPNFQERYMKYKGSTQNIRFRTDNYEQ